MSWGIATRNETATMMTTEVRVAERPQHPMPIRILNSVGRGLDRWGIEPVKLTRDALMKKAMKK